MNQSRRTAIKSTGAFASLVALGIVTQSQAQAAVDHASFQVKTLEDALKADETFDMLMGTEVAPRRRFIQTHAKDVVNLDV